MSYGGNAPGAGVEPTLTASEAAVLPLNDPGLTCVGEKGVEPLPARFWDAPLCQLDALALTPNLRTPWEFRNPGPLIKSQLLCL